jgi:hypothetical protein
MLAFPVIVGRNVGLRVARRHFVEHVEAADTLAGRKILGGDPAFGHVGDALGETLRADAKAGKVARPTGNDDHFLAALGDCRGGEGAGRGGRSGRYACLFDK